MKLTQKQQKIIELPLKKIYSKYKKNGLLSIYLWGSVLTEDFNPNLSDIDSIGIVNNKAKEEDCKKINQYLRENVPNYKNFKLNYLYLDELNGKNIKSRLARVIHPNLLLIDFKNWKHIAGKSYTRKDFKLKEISLNEAIQLSLTEAKKNHLPLFEKGDFKTTQYFIKNLMKVCYYLNQKDLGEHKFKYDELINKSPKERKNIVSILLTLKKSNWNKNLMKKNLPLLIDFINNLTQPKLIKHN